MNADQVTARDCMGANPRPAPCREKVLKPQTVTNPARVGVGSVSATYPVTDHFQVRGIT